MDSMMDFSSQSDENLRSLRIGFLIDKEPAEPEIFLVCIVTISSMRSTQCAV